MPGRNLWLLVVLSIFSWGCTTAAAPSNTNQTGFIQKVYRGANGQRSNYVVFVPHDYDSKSPSPAILFLHGLGQSGDDGLIQSERGLGAAIRDREQSFPFITIFPQSSQRSWLSDSKDGIRALQILDEVTKQYNVDSHRIYLTGYSMGGEGTWSLAGAHPDRFAAIIPICPGSDPGLVAKLKDIPCWCFQGDADDIATVSRTRDMVLAIKQAGGRPMYHEYPGVGHNCWDLTYANSDVYEWLLSQRRK